MSVIRSFKALRPAKEYAAQVAALPYDVMNSEEARIKVQGNPYSFLQNLKPKMAHRIEPLKSGSVFLL